VEPAQDKHADSEPTSPTHIPPTHIVGDPSNFGRELTHRSTKSAQEKPADGNNDSDRIMADNSNLPMYLILMIGYLREVAPDRVWQDLVMNLVHFEKFGHPRNGVSFGYILSIKHQPIFHYDYQNLSTKSRPHEIADWVRSKKKDVVPAIKQDVYGPVFMEWWGGLQPAWHQFQGAIGPLDLVCDVPKAETWQALKKGGTSGMYIVVMGLSWWIKGQKERNANAWAVVDDLSWVIRQMSDGQDSLASTSQKRDHEHESQSNEVEDQPLQKQRYVIFQCYRDCCLLMIVLPSHG